MRHGDGYRPAPTTLMRYTLSRTGRVVNVEDCSIARHNPAGVHPLSFELCTLLCVFGRGWQGEGQQWGQELTFLAKSLGLLLLGKQGSKDGL